MKTLTKISIVMLIPLLYCFLFTGFNSESSKQTPPPSPGGDGFINMIFNNGLDSSNLQTWLDHWFYHYKDSLHFNAIHSYDQLNGTYRYGYFDQYLNGEQIHNTTVLQDEAIETHGLAYFMERIKISKLCYAQRLVYEVKNPASSEKVNNGFCYQNTTGCYETDSSRTVLHVSPNPITNCPEEDATPRYLAQNIYENLQHSDLYDFNIQYADSGTWYMKPMMRIKLGDFSPIDSTPVVAIVTYNFSNNRIDSTIIKVRNFRNSSNEYYGNYIENFNFQGEIPLPTLQVSGSDTLANGLGKGSTGYDWWEWDNYCHIDFKVYWFGEVEVWYDKMTVDDKWANRLFDSDTLVNFDGSISQEVNAYTSEHWNFVYFADEITYSQVPAVKYVKQKLDAHGIKLMTATTNYLNVHGMKNDTLAHRYYMTELQPEFFSNDAHEIPWELPNTFVPTPPFDDAVLVSPAVYNEKLQFKLGDKFSHLGDPIQGTFIFQVELARQQIHDYSSSTKFIMQPQIHGFLYYSVRLGKFLWGVREPTNEEIQAQAMLSIAHGANGICWFTLNQDKNTAYVLLPF